MAANGLPIDDIELQEELTAYLDGELDPPQRRQVEERISSDARYRTELARLERAWDLLDRLPTAEVDAAFTRTTLEMVAVAAENDLVDERAGAPRRRRNRMAVILCSLAAASLAGVVAGRTLWPDPNLPLLRDLPVIENFELYHQADDVEFLRQLDRAGLFAEEGEHGP